jgi:hypothetical protein
MTSSANRADVVAGPVELLQFRAIARRRYSSSFMKLLWMRNMTVTMSWSAIA